MSAQLPGDIYDEDVDPAHGVIATALVRGTLDAPAPGDGIDLLSDTSSPAVIGHLSVDGTPSAIAFSPSGNRLAVTTLEGELDVFDVASRKLDFEVAIPGERGVGAGWTADEKRVLFGGQGLYEAIDVATRKVVAKQNVKSGSVFGFHTSGKNTLIANTETGTVLFYRADGTPSGRPNLQTPVTLQGTHTSPDGSLLAGTGGDGTLELWALPSGQSLTVPLPVTEGFALSAFLDSQRLVVSGDDDAVVSVNLAPSTLVKEACAIVGRNLTRSEFSQYLGSGA
jgi:WD40 repeat protein